VFCGECGIEVNDGAKFCSGCGSQQNGSATTDKPEIKNVSQQNKLNDEQREVIKAKQKDFDERFGRLDLSKYFNFATHVGFYRTTGTVLDHKRNSETYISGGGGGGYIGPRGGFISDSSVSSSVVNTDDFWIQTEDGKETSFSFVNKGISLRAGQRVTLVHAVPDNEDTGPYLFLINHNDGCTYPLVDSMAFFRAYVKGVRWSAYSYVLIFVLMLVLAYYGEQEDSSIFTTIAVLVAMPGLFIYLVRKVIRDGKRASVFQAHIDELKKWVLEQG